MIDVSRTGRCAGLEANLMAVQSHALRKKSFYFMKTGARRIHRFAHHVTIQQSCCAREDYSAGLTFEDMSKLSLVPRRLRLVDQPILSRKNGICLRKLTSLL